MHIVILWVDLIRISYFFSSQLLVHFTKSFHRTAKNHFSVKVCLVELISSGFSMEAVLWALPNWPCISFIWILFNKDIKIFQVHIHEIRSQNDYIYIYMLGIWLRQKTQPQNFGVKNTFYHDKVYLQEPDTKTSFWLRIKELDIVEKGKGAWSSEDKVLASLKNSKSKKRDFAQRLMKISAKPEESWKIREERVKPRTCELKYISERDNPKSHYLPSTTIERKSPPRLSQPVMWEPTVMYFTTSS